MVLAASAKTSSVKYPPVCLIRVQRGSLGKINVQLAQLLGIAVASRREGDLDKCTLGGGNGMKFQAVKKPAFAMGISAKGVRSGRFWVESTPVNPDVIASGNRTTVDDKHRVVALVGMGRFMHEAEPVEERLKHPGDRVQPPVELATAQPLTEIRARFQKVGCVLKVAAKEASGDNGGGHHLCIGDTPLRAFFVATAAEPIIDQAVCSDDSGVHGSGRLRERVSSLVLSISDRGTAFS